MSAAQASPVRPFSRFALRRPGMLRRRVRVAVGWNAPESGPDNTREVSLRAATTADAGAIHALIGANLAEGRLLARHPDEIRVHAHRFVLAIQDRRIVGCADLTPLGRTVAEVRSLVVDEDARSIGVGRLLLDELISRAETGGFDALCAFTHAPGYFAQRGFSIVPHSWIPEKIQTDCSTCPLFRHCGQYAVLLPLSAARTACVPLASLHG